MPRDISGLELIKKLEKLGYKASRQSGSHVRIENGNHKLTIPAHQSLKIGTLNGILTDISENLKISKTELVSMIF